ncbi:hypothetical protein [Pectobacterium actinidiae]|uniref:hypothetical protein n=1 Tax=Pectobacterium actinidiae TaxID=1507808 RepID=UPI00382B8724
MGMLQFVITGGLTLLASRTINTYNASDDIAQWVYPSVAVFSLWLSSFIEKRNTKKTIKEKIESEILKWKAICLEVRKSKESSISRIIAQESLLHKRHENSIRIGFKNAINEIQPNEIKHLQQEAKIEALSERNKELLIDIKSINDNKDYILTSRNSLEKKVSEFIKRLREFHQEMNRELKDNSSNNSAIWNSIDTLADKIFSEINSFNDYISASFIEERMSMEPMNRKDRSQVLDKDFSTPMKTIEKEKEAPNKKATQANVQFDSSGTI